jgi:DNA-binding Xre family transcriptional regulator
MLERLKAKGEVRRKRVRRLDSITNSMDVNLSKLLEIVKDREACSPWGCRESNTTEAT